MSQTDPRTQDMMDVARLAVSLAGKHGAAESAATASRERSVDVEWRDGKLDKITEATTRSLSIQLYVDGRYSAVWTSDLRPDALDGFIADAVVLTRALAPDEHRRLPEPELYQGRSTADLAIADASQASITADERRRYARELEEAARAADSRGAIVSVSTGFGDTATETHKLTSNGFEGVVRSTSIYGSADVSVKDSDGRRPEEYDYAVTRFLADLPGAAAIGRGAAARALARLGAKKGPSAVLPMVVENRAAGRLVAMLTGPLSGAAVQQKRSYLDGKLGQTIGGALLDVTDDPHIQRGMGSRLFDGEGIAARPMAIVEKGVLRAFYIDTYYGRKLGVRPTTGGPSNLRWTLGTKDQSQLVAGVTDGILVTGFLGGNSNAATGDFSLGIQGYRITKGAIAEPIGEMNIAGNQLDFWTRLAAVGNDPFLSSPLRTPTLVFDGVQFAGV
jgi:PmbA protein